MMQIQTVPADDEVVGVHDCLIHVVRFNEAGIRNRNLEPVPRPSHYKQDFEIENGKVRKVNETSDVNVWGNQVDQIDEITEVQEGCIDLGSNKNMLNMITLMYL